MRNTLAALSFAAVLGALAWWGTSPAGAPTAPAGAEAMVRRLEAAEHLGLSDPSEVERAVSDDERAIAVLGSVEAVQEAVAEAFEGATPTDRDLRSYYDLHRDWFGGRSFEASRGPVRELWRLEQTRHAVMAEVGAVEPN